MVQPKDVVEALRKKQFILIQEKKQAYLCGSTRDADLLTKAKERVGGIITPEAFILIGEAGQLYEYVMQVPEIAWEIIEYAEKSLHIIYGQGKGVSADLLLPENKIKVMLINQAPLKDMLFRLGHGVFCLPIKDEQKIAILMEYENTPVVTSTQVSADKVMELGLDGSVNFIKR